MSFPPPPGHAPIDSSRLTDNETDVILRATLRPQHAADPNVLNFIQRYLDCRDAKQAAKECGLTAASGPWLLKRPDIFHCISELTKKAVMKYNYSAEEVVERVKEVANFDPGLLQNADGIFVENLNDLPPEVRRGIKKFKAKNTYEKDPNGMLVVSGKIIEVEFWDKMKAIELLGREKEIFKETRRVENDVTTNMANVLLGARERSAQRQAQLQVPRDVTPVREDET